MKIVCILLFLILTILPVTAQCYQVATLRAHPTIESQVSWVIPSQVRIIVLEYSNWWVLVRVKWDIGVAKGEAEGWVPIYRVEREGN